MKRSILVILLTVCYVAINIASEIIKIDMQFETPQTEEMAIDSLFNFYKIPYSVNLKKTNYLEDNHGYSHSYLQQEYKGALFKDHAIILHSKNGFVESIIGSLVNITDQQMLASINPRSMFHSPEKPTFDSTLIIKCTIDGATEYRQVYRIISEELGSFLYIDVNTGDTIQKVPYIYDAQGKMVTNTIYSGRQSLTIERSGIWSVFKATNPRIETILSTGQDFSNGTANMYNTQIALCNNYYETDADSLNSYITAITFKITNNSWWEDFTPEGGVYPDFYIKIFDTDDNVVYISNVYENYRYVNVTFNPMLLLDGRTYKIHLYEQDAIADDDGGAFKITSTTKGIGKLSLANFDVTIEVSGNPVRDAHWGMEKTLNFYKTKLNRNSFDDDGAVVYQFVNPFHIDINTLPRNAFAHTEKPYCMVYGLGDGVTFHPVVSLDVMAHEFTHLVTAQNLCGGLEYQGESGALNEGFSDVFASLVEKYVYGKFDWTIGEKLTIGTPFIRSMQKPKEGKQPDTYVGTYWKETTLTDCDTCDHGGVHTNSGVLNYWFFLLTEGGSGTNDKNEHYAVKGVGQDIAAQIAYNTLMYELTTTATFADARAGALSATKRLYGTNSQAYKSVMNAWYAVGVGEAYQEQFELKPGKYAIVASRAKETDKNWFYMSAAKDGTKDRFQAINTEKTDINAVNLKDLPDDYIWELVADGSNWKLKNGSQYITWTSNNTAKLDATGKSLTFNIADNQVEAYFNDGTADRYLSLNGTTGNNYFAFYGNKNQITHLFFLPVEGTTPTPPTPPTPTEKEYYIVAKRSTGNYYFFTPDKVSGKERLIAVDAGTDIRSMIDTISTTNDYLWILEDSGTGKLLKSHNGSYLTCTAAKSAKMADNGTVLNLTNNSDGTVTFSYAADATTTHYLSLANAGNDYFVFYANTNQVTHLLLLPKGNGAASEVDHTFTAPQCTKFMQDGKVYIKRDGVLYNMMGERIR